MNLASSFEALAPFFGGELAVSFRVGVLWRILYAWGLINPKITTWYGKLVGLAWHILQRFRGFQLQAKFESFLTFLYILTMTFASIKFDLSCLRHGHLLSLRELSSVLLVMAGGRAETPARKNLHATSWMDCCSSKGNAGISMPCSFCQPSCWSWRSKKRFPTVISCAFVEILGDEITRTIPTICRPYIWISYRGYFLGSGGISLPIGANPLHSFGGSPNRKASEIGDQIYSHFSCFIGIPGFL